VGSIKRVALIGFSGTGKSTTARHLAERLAWQAIDMDGELERRFGLSIPQVFARHGEETFRQVERAELARALSLDSTVVATGGGASAMDDAWSPQLLGNPETLTVALDASPETILARLTAQQALEGSTVIRPMLAGNDPLVRIADLKAVRQQVYDRAAITLVVDAYCTDEIAATIERLLPFADSTAVQLNAPSGNSTIFIQPGLLAQSGALARRRWPRSARAWIVTDQNVGKIHGPATRSSLEREGFACQLLELQPGESSKSLQTAGLLYDGMLNGGIERADIVVALGGGVIGDLAGFVAATVLRGVGLVQIPTSLLAMVDSSVGGKTGINHSAGKNLVGAFYQPPIVVVDPELLRTLPQRELAQGWAEIVKHAIIQVSTPGGEPGDLERFLVRNAQNLLALKEPALSYLVRRNIELKSRVVEADEKESGIRAYLNFGHTLGHAVEASDYSLMHGEAVALGIRAATQLSKLQGRISDERVHQIEALLERFGLPQRGNFDVNKVLSLIASDKKRSKGRQKWILLKPGGGVEATFDVAPSEVSQALAHVASERSSR
jgi:shikimate kinase/3-dehydroquinate synthase